MKLLIPLVGLSVTIMVFMIAQTVRQELVLRDLKSRISTSASEVKMKEEAIVEVKVKLQEVKLSLKSLETKVEEVKKKKIETEKSEQEFLNGLQTCNTQREQTKVKSTEITESMNKLKADHEEAKSRAQHDIQTLKQQILDRDKAICAFADTTKDEARRLCGL
ncbi:uncharacterized protein si:dkey-87o1.2 [Acanthochromis polyacanthus]|uniref:Si:dkey-87o1.2 n=1 Tax=Acanthochromis polyacanthus TaxID=80966 RepID=A0A3Q1FQG6_9TELE|nr:uncharacterized protein si:dkey-87o1.2 [Acanthochromis polyacanthus]